MEKLKSIVYFINKDWCRVNKENLIQINNKTDF